MILSGKLSMGHARELSKLEDNDVIVKYANQIVNENLSVRDIEAISKEEEIKKKNPIIRNSRDNKYQYVEREMVDYLGTKVKIKNKRIEIAFNNDNDLDRILELMNIKFN